MTTRDVTVGSLSSSPQGRNSFGPSNPRRRALGRLWRGWGVLLQVLLACSSHGLLGVDAVSTDASDHQARIKANARKKDLDATKSLLTSQLSDLQNSAAVEILKRAYREYSPTAGVAPFTLPPGAVGALKLDPNAIAELDSASAAKISQLESTRATLREVDMALVSATATASESGGLSSLKAAPSFQINTGSNASASYVPGIDFWGKFALAGPKLNVEVLVNIKPDPPSGTPDEVAQSVRINTGVFSGNLGVKYSTFWNAGATQGFEARVGLPVSYQRASATSGSVTAGSTQGSSTSATSDFGIVSPEVKLSVWLEFLLLGYKYNYYSTFGTGNAVSENLQHTGGHTVYVACRIDALSGSDSTSPFYVEGTYTSKGGSFSGGTLSLSFAKALSWPQH